MVTYYEILELVPTATDADIRRAYKKLSLKYHPDKNKNSTEATNKFKKISEAYQVLSDQMQRLAYDKKLRHDARRTTHHHHRSRSTTEPFSTSPFFTFKSAHDIFRGFFKDEDSFNTDVRSKHFGQNITRQTNAAASNRKEPRNFMSFMWDPFETFTEINMNNNINSNNNNKNVTYTKTTFGKDGQQTTTKIVIENNIQTTYRYEKNELVSKTVKTCSIAK